MQPSMTTPDTAAAREVGQHHLAEDAAAQVAARVHDHDVAGLGVVEHVAVELPLRVGVLVVAVQVLALGHELERQRRADDRLPGVQDTGPWMWALRMPRPLSSPARGRAADRPLSASIRSAGGRVMSGVWVMSLPMLTSW